MSIIFHHATTIHEPSEPQTILWVTSQNPTVLLHHVNGILENRANVKIHNSLQVLEVMW